MNSNIPSIGLPRIVIIGCGFAGLKLVKKINTKNYQVVLLDKNNYHTFQPLMYQVASSSLEPDSIVYPIRKVFKGKKNFHFRMTDVHHVNVDTKEVDSDLGIIKYDHLVIATGAVTNFFGLKNIEKFGYTMKSLRESLDLRSLIIQNFEKALSITDLSVRDEYMNFVIVGGGATGIELAGALAELKKNILPKDYPDLDIRQMQIHIIEASDKVLPSMSEKASSQSYKFLKKLGVNIWLNTFVKDYDGSTVISSKTDFKARTLIWSAGVKGLPVAGLEKSLNKSNRIITDQFNKVIGQENVFAIGDVASIESEMDGKGHPMLASIAGQQGHTLGVNFNAMAKGKELKPFNYNDRGTMATIGRNKAVVDLPFFKFSGGIAWLVWMFLHLMLLVDFRNRLIVFMNWSWSYFNYDKGLRLIIRKTPSKKEKEEY
ncbi:NAD(P)/FAD-dependent oxidoreductase [uncultured Tenacibaculum sp.]|uniref:NAD(P)/FAD-dependent oxidoreductase n=1 Tax=uncultured Tenacibaculum sp. TaxID=174713 RepID=UPI0026314711|nr:NAD(P)/FAD-dependent oxidoreductase [uncultured Tenacibaculum sp.]